MSPFAIAAYSLIIIFFICFTCLLLFGTRSHQPQAAASAPLPSPKAAPLAYLFLTVLVALFIILTVFAHKDYAHHIRGYA